MTYSMVASEKGAPLHGMPLGEGDEALLQISINRMNAAKSQRVGIHHFPKPKDCNWFVIIFCFI